MTGSRPRLANLSRLLAVLIGLSFVGEMAAVVWLRYSASPPETDCRDIPSGTVVLAPAFWNLGRNASTGRYWPGRANQRIARKLEACADRFSLVLTQQAVSDALAVPDKLSNGTPVWSMHADVPRYVSTLEALQCAVEHLHSRPGWAHLGLMAHDKHMARCRQALEAVFEPVMSDVAVVEIHLGTVEFQDEHWSRPWCWAAQETLKWPVQSLQIALGRIRGFHCGQ